MRRGRRGRCCAATAATTPSAAATGCTGAITKQFTTTTTAAALRHDLSFQSNQLIANKHVPARQPQQPPRAGRVDTLALDALADACAARTRVASKLAIPNEFP